MGDHLPPANTEPQINKTLTPTNTRKSISIVWKQERENYEKFTINHRFCLGTITQRTVIRIKNIMAMEVFL